MATRGCSADFALSTANNQAGTSLPAKIIPAHDGFHHFVFVGLKASDRDQMAATIKRLQSAIAQIVETSQHIVSCLFLGNQTRYADDLNFGFHAIFDSEQGLEAVRASPDHLAMIEWFDTVSNGKRTEINAIVQNGKSQGSTRPNNQGLLTRPA